MITKQNLIFSFANFATLDWSLKQNSNSITQFKEKLTGLFPKFLWLSLKSEEQNKENEAFQIMNGEDPNYRVELNLTKDPPSTICFAFEYKHYLNNYEIKANEKKEFQFSTRDVFSLLLPAEFKLSDIFSGVDDIPSSSDENASPEDTPRIKPEDYPLILTSLIGYNNHHYTSFTRFNKEWYLWEDSNTNLLGNVKDLFDYLENSKILPILVFYQTWEDK